MEIIGLDCAKFQNRRLKGIEKFNRISQKMNSFLLQFEEQNVQKRGESCNRLVFKFLERERLPYL